MYQLHSQNVFAQVDLSQRILQGSVELEILAAEPLLDISLNCRQATISLVTVNEAPCNFTHIIPKAADGDVLGLAAALQYHSMKPEVTINVPLDKRWKRSEQGFKYTVVVNFQLTDPTAGIYFVDDDECSYMYTNAPPGATHFWLPCIESPEQMCTWRFEITTPHDVVVLTSANTKEEVSHGNKKVTISEQLIPICATSVCLVVGQFEQVEVPYLLKSAQTGSGTSSASLGPPAEAPSPPLATAAVGTPDAASSSSPDPSMSCFLYGPPAYLPQMEYTARYLPQIFSFLARYTGIHLSRLFGCFHFIFINQSGIQPRSWAGIALMSTEHLLHDRDADDHLSFLSRLTYLLCRQYFGHYLIAHGCSEEWIAVGLAGFITMAFLRSVMGINAFRMWLHTEGAEVYEACEKARLVLVPHAVLNIAQLDTELFRRKAALVMYMLVSKIDDKKDDMATSHFRASVAKLLQHERQASPAQSHSGRLLDAQRLNEELFLSDGVDSMEEFLNYWVQRSSLPSLSVGYRYVPPEGAQSEKKMQLGVQQVRWAGDDVRWWKDVFWIRITEEGGEDAYDTQVAGEMEVQDYAIVTKFKKRSRRRASESVEEYQRKRMEEDADRLRCPVEFVHIDHGQRWPLNRFELFQPEAMLINQLQKDYDVVGQYRAVEGLSKCHTSLDAFFALEAVMKSSDYYYAIRVRAARALAQFRKDPVMGADDILPFDTLKEYFRSIAFNTRPAPFGDYLFPNDFQNVPLYQVRKGLIQAIGEVEHISTATDDIKCDAVYWLLQVLRDNNNEENKFDDTVYICTIIDAISNALFLIASKLPTGLVSHDEDTQTTATDLQAVQLRTALVPPSSALHGCLASATDTLQRLMGVDKPAKPLTLFTNRITVHCVHALARLQHARLIPFQLPWFWAFVSGVAEPPTAVVRLAAFDGLLGIYTELSETQLLAAAKSWGSSPQAMAETPLDFTNFGAFFCAVLDLLEHEKLPDMRWALLEKLYRCLKNSIQMEVVRSTNVITVEKWTSAIKGNCPGAWWRFMKANKDQPCHERQHCLKFLNSEPLQLDPKAQVMALDLFDLVFGVEAPDPVVEAEEEQQPVEVTNRRPPEDPIPVTAPPTKKPRPTRPPAPPSMDQPPVTSVPTPSRPAVPPTTGKGGSQKGALSPASKGGSQRGAPSPKQISHRSATSPASRSSASSPANTRGVSSPHPASPRTSTLTVPQAPTPPPTTFSRQPITLYIEPATLRARQSPRPILKLVHVELKSKEMKVPPNNHLVAKLSLQSETAALIFRQLPLDHGNEPSCVHIYEGIATWQVDKRKVKRATEEDLAREWIHFTELAWWADHSIVIAGYGPSCYNPPTVRNCCYLEKPCTVFGEVILGDPRKMLEPHRREGIEVPNVRVEMARCRRLVLVMGNQELPVDLYPCPPELIDWLYRILPIEATSAVYGHLITAAFARGEPPKGKNPYLTKRISYGEIAHWRQTGANVVDHLVMGSGPLHPSAASSAASAITLEYPVTPIGRVLIPELSSANWDFTPESHVILQRRQMALHFYPTGDPSQICCSLLLTLDNTPTADEIYEYQPLPLYCPIQRNGGLITFDTPLVVKKEKWRETQAIQVGQLAFRGNCVLLACEGDRFNSCPLNETSAWPWAQVTGIRMGSPTSEFQPLKSNDLPRMAEAMGQVTALAVPQMMNLCLEKYLHHRRHIAGFAD